MPPSGRRTVWGSRERPRAWPGDPEALRTLCQGYRRPRTVRAHREAQPAWPHLRPMPTRRSFARVLPRRWRMGDSMLGPQGDAEDGQCVTAPEACGTRQDAPAAPTGELPAARPKRVSWRRKFLTPEAKAIARRLRDGSTYQLLAFCPHEGVRRLAAALLIKALEDEVRKAKRPSVSGGS
jgi:hypothetical protein